MRNGEGLSMEQVIAFIENAPANIFFKDTSCRYRAVSEACALINGKENFDIIGKTDVEIWADHEVGQRYYVDDLHILETGNPANGSMISPVPTSRSSSRSAKSPHTSTTSSSVLWESSLMSQNKSKRSSNSSD